MQDSEGSTINPRDPCSLAASLTSDSVANAPSNKISHPNIGPRPHVAQSVAMAAEQRKLLEQLMGSSATSRTAQLSLSDPKVCRSYLVGTCPHDLFTNTKQDIGQCPKVHAESLKTEYENLSDREKQRYGFEYDYMRDLQKYIDECNRRIDAAQRRLEKTPDEIRQTNVLVRYIFQ